MIRNTINKDPKKVKRQKFFAKYGIGLAIGGCALVATIVTIVTGNIGQSPEPNQLSLETTEVPEFEYIENPTALPEQISAVEEDPEDAPEATSAPVEQVSQQIIKTNDIVPELVIPVNGEITREFAKTRLVYSPTLKEYCTHLAVDFEGAAGQSVVAAADGEVILCGSDKMLGSYVLIKHSDNVTTGYYSLESYNVKTGDQLAAGDVLGTVGCSALLESSLGEHVHFEMTIDGINVDPTEHFITK